MSLSLDQVRKVAKLARLELSEPTSPDATATLRHPRLRRALNELNTDGVEPLAHPLPMQNVFRPDEPAPSLPVDAAAPERPARVGDYFGVPAVFDRRTGQSLNTSTASP